MFFIDNYMNLYHDTAIYSVYDSVADLNLSPFIRMIRFIFYLAVQLYCTLKGCIEAVNLAASALLFETVFDDRIVKFNRNRIL